MSKEKQFWHHEESNTVFTTKPGEDIAVISEHCAEVDKKQFKKLQKKKGATKGDTFTPPKAKRKSKAKSKAEPKAKAGGKKKASTPRGKGLGVGGKPLTAAQKKKATTAIKDISRATQKIRHLITEFDADNESIEELVECEEVQIQRTRRAILREAKK